MLANVMETKVMFMWHVVVQVQQQLLLALRLVSQIIPSAGNGSCFRQYNTYGIAIIPHMTWMCIYTAPHANIGFFSLLNTS